MKRIYSNYRRLNKWMGIIDYKTLVCIVVYELVILSILKIININFIISFYIFIMFSMPVIVALCINVKNESMIDVMILMIKFFINKKIFVKNIYSDFDNNVYRK